MSGVKGKSGRKADPNGSRTRYKKITFYVAEHLDFDGWKLDPTFVWFKRHHGAKWQQKVRQWMYNDVKHWRDPKNGNFWRCECPNTGVLGNYIHTRQPQCYKCQQWKNESVRRIHDSTI